jgi:transcriptional regulator with XRE-family HTH domain
MSPRNALLAAPPYPVERTIKTLGQNLRTARLRRNLSLAEVAERIGVNRRVVGDAERGKPSTAIAVYVALLWAFGLTDQLAEVASPDNDEEGSVLARARERGRPGSARGLDDDF